MRVRFERLAIIHEAFLKIACCIISLASPQKVILLGPLNTVYAEGVALTAPPVDSCLGVRSKSAYIDIDTYLHKRFYVVRPKRCLRQHRGAPSGGPVWLPLLQPRAARSAPGPRMPPAPASPTRPNSAHSGVGAPGSR
ncbi:hypothetical protein CNECB9_3480004 [Cupriavidus necator]|uniref:Uncharacterized protein n=1 Tax=Cupriavidus necator TaxID=106590 RepID=A0A1K0IHH8_CUPNE|nr:hypothetical protein CNECB9_3480004 [Cupriavidus necator]